MDAPQSTDELIRTAITQRRQIRFWYDGKERIAEPHDYGVIDGQRRLFFYQVGGGSQSGRPIGWRWADLRKIADLRLLDRRFPGPRAAPTGRHHR